MTVREGRAPCRPKESIRSQRQRSSDFTAAHTGSKWLILPRVEDNPVKPPFVWRSFRATVARREQPQRVSVGGGCQSSCTPQYSATPFLDAQLLLWLRITATRRHPIISVSGIFQHFGIKRHMSGFFFCGVRFLKKIEPVKMPRGGLEVYTFHGALKIAAVSRKPP